VIDYKQIQVAVFVVIKKRRLRGIPLIGDSIFLGLFRKSEVAIVDEQKIFSPCCKGIRRTANVNVKLSVTVDVNHGGSGTPSLLTRNTAPVGDVFKFKIALVQVQAILYHISGEENILQTVVVDVANGYTCAVVEIGIIKYVKIFVFEKNVPEINTGSIGIKFGKKMGGVVFAAECSD